MKKRIIFMFILFLFSLNISHPQETLAAECGKTNFSIILKEKTDLKEKKDSTSATVKTLAKETKVGVVKRKNSWYQVCYNNRPVYIKAHSTKEVFTTDEKRIMNKALKEKGAKQVLTVIGEKNTSTSAAIRAYENKYGEWRRVLIKMSGVVGKKGFTNQKTEGDGKTPIGMYAFGTAFGKTKKLDSITWPYKKTTKNDFWVDDPSSKDYNKWVRYTGNPDKKWKSYEVMDHPLYRYGAVISYNTNPIIKGKGSAIFLHVWRGRGTSTAGCAATTEKNVVRILSWLDPAKKPQIVLSSKTSLKNL